MSFFGKFDETVKTDKNDRLFLSLNFPVHRVLGPVTIGNVGSVRGLICLGADPGTFGIPTRDVAPAALVTQCWQCSPTVAFKASELGGPSARLRLRPWLVAAI